MHVFWSYRTETSDASFGKDEVRACQLSTRTFQVHRRRTLLNQALDMQESAAGGGGDLLADVHNEVILFRFPVENQGRMVLITRSWRRTEDSECSAWEWNVSEFERELTEAACVSLPFEVKEFESKYE